MNDTKICGKCGETKSVNEFSKARGSKDGLFAHCKSCQKAYYEANREKLAAYREANKEKVSEGKKAYREANKEKVSEGMRLWCKNNPDKCNATSARRRARKHQAFPQWARTGEHKEAIDAMYTEAKRLEAITGIPHHVDHIHPLKSNFVCGLHLAVNLRVVVAQVNLSKGNKFVPYVESEVY